MNLLSVGGIDDASVFSIEQIVGEELGVLPGMDPIFSALALERLVQFFRNVAQRYHNEDNFDVIIYDGMSSEEMLRMIGAARKARLMNTPNTRAHAHTHKQTFIY